VTDVADPWTRAGLARAIVELSTQGIALLDRDGRLVASNPALQRLLGRAPAALTAMRLAELVHPDDAADGDRWFAALVAGERADYQIEQRLVCGDGAVVWARVTATVHPSAADRLVIAMIDDLTLARAATAASAGLVHQLGERVKELTFLHRCAGLLLAAEAIDDPAFAEVAALLPAAFQYPGITTASVELAGRTYATPGHRRTAWLLTCELTAADDLRGAIEVAYHEPRPDQGAGHGPFLAEEVTLLRSLAHMLRGAVARIHAGDVARRAHDRLQLALSAAGMGVWERDLATEQVVWHENLVELLGGVGELRGRFRAFAELVHPDDRADVVALLSSVDDAPRTIEFRLRCADGSWRPVAGTGRVVAGPDGVPDRFLAVVKDITAQRALEAGVQQAQKIEILGQLAGGVAHDLNNLLMVVRSASVELRARANEPAAPDLLDDIDDAVGRAAGLTRQLLAFSRRTDLEPCAVALEQLMVGMRPLLERLLGREIALRTALDAPAAQVWADPSQLEQMILNLVVNARDAMAGVGTITIATERRGGDETDPGVVFLTVTDTGPGVAADIVDRIFEPFFTTKPAGQGTGLGLAVVLAVARQWRGDVTVDSVPGQGATFRVRLPLLPA